MSRKEIYDDCKLKNPSASKVFIKKISAWRVKVSASKHLTHKISQRLTNRRYKHSDREIPCEKNKQARYKSAWLDVDLFLARRHFETELWQGRY